MAEEKKEEYKFRGEGLEDTEKRNAHKKFDEYCEAYHISSVSDLQLLEELVYRETLGSRIKYTIADKKKNQEKEQKEITVAKYMIEALNENLEQILALKEKLGLFENKDGQSGFEYIQQLKEKFKKWMAENNGSRTVVCPHCSKLILLKIRTDIWEAQQHPMFKDKILYNQHLIDMYLAGKITAEDVAKVLGTSPKYCEWLIEKFHQRKTKENEENE